MRHATRYSFRQLCGFGFLAIFAGVTSSLINPAVGQSQAPTLDRPPTPSVGDTFTFKWDGQNVVRTYIGQKDGLDCYLEKASSGQSSETCFTSDTHNLVRRVGTWKPVELTPHVGQYSFPLFVGKQWEASYTLVGAARPRTITARVVSYEKITVPAGIFDAFKILANTHVWGTQSREEIGGESIEYYSPKLGLIKEDVMESWGSYAGATAPSHHVELISYSLTKPGA